MKIRCYVLAMQVTCYVPLDGGKRSHVQAAPVKDKCA